MSLLVMKEIVFIAMGDETYRRKLVFEPEEVLEPYDLTEEERYALRTGDYEKLKQLGLDPQLAEYGAKLFSRVRRNIY